MLDGKIAVVVGAGSIAPGWSNGKATAVTYARHGAAVVCVDRRLEAAEETAAVIESEGGRALALAADAADEAEMVTVVERTVAELDGIDVLHNNVGVGGTGGLPDDIAPDDWDRELRQNLTSAYIGMRCVAPVMRARGGGVVTNTSSTLAVRFLRHPTTAYTASKAAVEALTRACAAGYASEGIRVNCIRIGFSETPLLVAMVQGRGLGEEAERQAMARSRAKVPMGEHADPFDIAEVAAFLASDAARHVTGVVLDVDGGLACAPL